MENHRNVFNTTEKINDFYLHLSKSRKNPLATIRESNKTSNIIIFAAQEKLFSTSPNLFKSAQSILGVFYGNLRTPRITLF